MLKYRQYNDEDMQHSRAANPFIKYSPAPVAQQPTLNGAPNASFDEAQHPDPYEAANPTRPSTCKENQTFYCQRVNIQV